MQWILIFGEELVDKLVSLWGKGATWEQDNAYHPHEAHSLSLDCSKARLKLGWVLQISLDQGLEQIITWSQAYGSGTDMRPVTEAAIAQWM